jgi:hypothetical protein
MILQEAQQNAWLTLAENKNTVVQELTNKELELQSLSDFTLFKKKYKEMIEYRKSFTSIISDSLITPLMEFEKRCEVRLKELEKIDLENRKIEAAKVDAINAKNLEASQFKTHCINEYHRISTKLRTDIFTELDRQYKWHLEHLEQNETPILSLIKDKIPAIPIDSMVKFSAAYLTKDEMAEIFATIPKPKYHEIYDVDLGMFFANFESDRKNAQAAIENRQVQADVKRIEDNKKYNQEVAVNNLISASETVVLDAPKIKKELKIVEENSVTWANCIMGSFMINFPSLQKYVRVKSWSNLSIGQMAEALAKHCTDTGEKLNGLTFEEIEK